MKSLLRLLLALAVLAVSASAETISNGGFEQGLAGWRPLWTNQPDTGSVALDSETVHSGKNSARIEYRAEKDWSFEPAVRVAVQPGELFEMEAWIRVSGGGNVSLCLDMGQRRESAGVEPCRAHDFNNRRLAAVTNSIRHSRRRDADSTALDRLWSCHGPGGRFFARKESDRESCAREGFPGHAQDCQSGAFSLARYRQRISRRGGPAHRPALPAEAAPRGYDRHRRHDNRQRDQAHAISRRGRPGNDGHNPPGKIGA